MKHDQRAAQPPDDDMLAADLAHIVHPFSRLDALPATGIPIFVEGRGVRLYDRSGQEYLDGVSGLYNVQVGYGRQELADAAAAQMAKLSFAQLFFGLGNEPSIRLAVKLAEITPLGIERFLFTLSGSDANDTALKLVRYRNILQGRPKKVKVIARRHSYHGMTFGAVTATGEDEYKHELGPLIPGFSHIDQPAPGDPSAPDVLESRIREEGPDTVAAFIAEPVSLPSGVIIPDANYWPRIREICTRYDVALIADEVITGFGRTGKMFGLNHWNVVPDLLVLSKGITSGYLPLGAVGLIESFYKDLAVPGKVFPHGFTASGHPASCAVALRNIEIIEREGLVEQAVHIGDYLRRRLDTLQTSSRFIGAVRSLGMLAAIDLVADGREYGSAGGEARLGQWAAETLRERRLIARFYGDTLVLAPSLVATQPDIDEITGHVEEVIMHLLPDFLNSDASGVRT